MSFGLIAGTSALLLLAAGCSSSTPDAAPAAPPRIAGTAYTVKDSSILATFDASGIATPVQQSTLSSKLMGTVLTVSVHEGDVVALGQALLRIDARELVAKEGQVAASITGAEAMHREATLQAGRIRALYADSAATKSQLDAAETSLARAESGVRAARAASDELGAVSAYAVVRAPFAGTITRRFVDPGAFASPGAPLITIQDGRRLRISANATPDVAARVHRGQHVQAVVENRTVDAIVEGVVPATAGNLYTINALVANPAGSILPGSAATLRLSLGVRSGLLIPTAALVREGDLVGVMLRTATGDRTRWIQASGSYGAMTEVIAGLRAGDVVVVPVASAGN